MGCGQTAEANCGGKDSSLRTPIAQPIARGVFPSGAMPDLALLILEMRAFSKWPTIRSERTHSGNRTLRAEGRSSVPDSVPTIASLTEGCLRTLAAATPELLSWKGADCRWTPARAQPSGPTGRGSRRDGTSDCQRASHAASRPTHIERGHRRPSRRRMSGQPDIVGHRSIGRLRQRCRRSLRLR